MFELFEPNEYSDNHLIMRESSIDTYDKSENLLLARVKSGDHEAFQQIYWYYAKRITLKLMRILRSEELVKDVLQDVFVKFWNYRDHIEVEQPAGKLLYRIATNMAYNKYQSAVREQLYLAGNPYDDSYFPTERIVEGKEIKQVIDQALQKLSPRTREVYTLHKIDGLSYKEIEDKLDISKSAINHHIQDGTKQLRKFLKPYYGLLILYCLY